MKKIITILLCVSFILVFNPVMADENKNDIEFHTATQERIDYDKTPLMVELEINGNKEKVYYSTTESYYYKGEYKIVISKIVDNNDALISTSSVSINTFLNDFTNPRVFTPKEIRLNPVVSWTLETVTTHLATCALTYLGLPHSLSKYIVKNVKRVASAIMDNPPEHAVRMDIVQYVNKRCTQFLIGETFYMTSNGTRTPQMYSYTWTENPSLGYVNTSCKMESQRYPYQYGIGE